MAEETASVLRDLDGVEPDMEIPEPTVTRTQPGKSITPVSSLLKPWSSFPRFFYLYRMHREWSYPEVLREMNGTYITLHLYSDMTTHDQPGSPWMGCMGQSGR
jgi:hypothetical protein